MKVLVTTYPAVTILGGGLRSQVDGTCNALAEEGVEVARFDPWEEMDLGGFDLCHLFGANIGTYHTAATLHRAGMKTVVSPIFFTRRSRWAVRATIRVDRRIRRLVRGVWTDYGIASDICRWADLVLPNTSTEADMVVRGLCVPADRVGIVPNGVDERFYNADPGPFREKYGLEHFVLSVGFIGMERKNFLRLFQALKDIDRPAVIIGGVWGGAYADACRKAAEGAGNITILEPLPSSSPLLASAYAACDAFVLPSLYETPGIAALEAALAGARVVITPLGGTRDYFGDLAEYVNPFSTASIRDGIRRALDGERGDGLREHIRREFTWKRVAELTMAAYRDVLGG
jgi:glycosyltransferase involved in cell wall biosynthesis